MVATRVGVGGLGPGGVGSSVCHIQTPLPGPICLHIHECRFAPVVAAGTYPRHKETYSMSPLRENAKTKTLHGIQWKPHWHH